MVIAFTLVVMGTAVTACMHLFRRHGAACVVAWVITASIVFVNIGFLAFHLVNGANPSHFSATGTLVSSTGLLTVTVVGLLLHVIKETSRNTAVPAVKIVATHDEVRLTTFRLVLLCIAILGPAWLYFYFLGTVPLLQGIRAVSSEGLSGLGVMNAARLARDPYASTGTYIPMQGLLQTFRSLGAPVVFAYALLLYRQGYIPKVAIIVMALALVTSLAAGQRWPLLYLGLAAILAVGATTPRFPAGVVMRYAAAATVLGVVLSMLQGRTLQSLTDLATAVHFGIANLVERVFIDQVAVPTLSYGPSGDSLRGLFGESYVVSLVAYLPGPGASFPVTFYQTVTGDSRAYTAPPDFFTEAYINFGLAGVVLLSAIWTALIAGYDLAPFNRTAERVSIRAVVGTVLALSIFNGFAFTLSVALVVFAAQGVFWISSQVRLLPAASARRLARTRQTFGDAVNGT